MSRHNVAFASMTAQAANWPLAVVIFLAIVLAAIRLWMGWKERH